MDPSTNRNFYAPPEARVGDVVMEAPSTNRDVWRACNLIWASCALGLLLQITETVISATTDHILSTVGGGAVGTAIVFWCVAKLKARRNWMRLLYTIVKLAGYALMVLFWNFYYQYYSATTERFVILVLQVLVNLCAVILLNTKSARHWFTRFEGAAA
jgi:hypothetical protein